MGEASDDVYMRIAGINDMGADHSIAWCRSPRAVGPFRRR
jgi:hypothetical protein